ncbi:hypothetical protein [Weizmannia acidilactici]|uniref:hypothetical protein n=1 Tax=Weizmannia acidilactici TaxID=2607726 RepID=UPI00124ED7D9|nr:hypothetical protein [Weizmannia acidilactici]
MIFSFIADIFGIFADFLPFFADFGLRNDLEHGGYPWSRPDFLLLHAGMFPLSADSATIRMEMIRIPDDDENSFSAIFLRKIYKNFQTPYDFSGNFFSRLNKYNNRKNQS